jgi:phage gp36-like protein
MYSTEQDILKRIRKREFDKLVESISGEPASADILSEAISTADSIIDGYLKNVVKTLPLTEPPEVITDCSATISIYILHSRIQYHDIPAFWKQRYDAAVSYLRDVSKGLANLETTIEEADIQESITSYYNINVFNRDGY